MFVKTDTSRALRMQAKVRQFDLEPSDQFLDSYLGSYWPGARQLPASWSAGNQLAAQQRRASKPAIQPATLQLSHNCIGCPLQGQGFKGLEDGFRVWILSGGLAAPVGALLSASALKGLLGLAVP